MTQHGARAPSRFSSNSSPSHAIADGSLPKRVQMKFSPNTGYAFAVADDTWHSADKVGPEVKTRDPILLTYFVDKGLLRLLRNRGKADRQFPPQ